MLVAGKNTKELHFLAKLLKIFHLNLQRGLQQKLDKLQIDRQQLNPDILMLTEHGLSKGLIENTIIPHYKLQADFSHTDHRWGGAAIYTTNSVQIDLNKIHTEPYSCEIAAVDIKISRKTLTLICVYRPTSGKIADFLQV